MKGRAFKASDGSATPPLGYKDDSFELRLTFDRGPKDLQRGFVFGTNPQVCDVFLGPSHRTISRRHFCITFDEHRRLIIQESSTHGTAVGYDRQPKEDEKRTNTNITIHLPLGEYQDMTLRIEGVNREWEKGDEQYNNLRDSYLRERGDAIPPLDVLGIQSQSTTMAPTGSHSPRQRPIYLKREKLGSGSFGTVHRMIDVSTGEVYAGKRFNPKYSFETEITILRKISHSYSIMRVQSRRQKFNRSFSKGWKHSTISTLSTLSIGTLKPENILLRCRAPLSIALADFGLSNQKDQSFVETICGTYPYCAPEIFERAGYFTAVDVWALGVVVLKYLQGIPVWKRVYTKHDLPWWTERITATAVKIANASPEDPCHAILVKMLQLDHWDRPSAGECLAELISNLSIDERFARPSLGSSGAEQQTIRDPCHRMVTGQQANPQSERLLPEILFNKSIISNHHIKRPLHTKKRKHLSGSLTSMTDGIPKR
ncbi:MAG: hypothetical protein M1816_006012 [Peltula sp. TS41687]|nr:MAG: hypothetical protein M1816_006012 [Peltula sp. TS41687]